MYTYSYTYFISIVLKSEFFGTSNGSISKENQGYSDSKIVEAKDQSISLLWARDVGLKLQSVELDALSVFQNLRSSLPIHFKFGDLLSDVNHVFHEANTAAHGFTSFALRLDYECIWLEKNSPTIESVIVLESFT